MLFYRKFCMFVRDSGESLAFATVVCFQLQTPPCHKIVMLMSTNACIQIPPQRQHCCPCFCPPVRLLPVARLGRSPRRSRAALSLSRQPSVAWQDCCQGGVFAGVRSDHEGLLRWAKCGGGFGRLGWTVFSCQFGFLVCHISGTDFVTGGL